MDYLVMILPENQGKPRPQVRHLKTFQIVIRYNGYILGYFLCLLVEELWACSFQLTKASNQDFKLDM